MLSEQPRRPAAGVKREGEGQVEAPAKRVKVELCTGEEVSRLANAMLGLLSFPNLTNGFGTCPRKVLQIPTQGERQQGLVKIDSYIGCVEERVSGCMG